MATRPRIAASVDGCILRILDGLMTLNERRTASACPTARSTSSRSARSTRR